MMRNEALPHVTAEEPFRLTREEQEFVRKCLGNQLWKNEIPWSFATGLLAKMAMKVGYIKQSNVTLFTTVLGAFVCSRALSYGTCFQQLMQQPGNTVAERMNMKKRIIYNQPSGRTSTYPGEPESTYTQQPNYLDVDIDKPDYPGIDPSVPSPSDEAVLTPRPGQTYAELRRQNRESYQQQFRGSRSAPPPPTTEKPSSGLTQLPPSSSSPYESSSYSFDSAVGSYDRASTAESERPASQIPVERSERSPYEARTPRRTLTNKYGDVWDE